jgi:glucokinase
MSKFIGVDLGGTDLKAAVVDTDSGEQSALKTVPTHAERGYEAVMARMGELIESVIEVSDLMRAEISGIGIGVPGVLDLDKGLVLFLPNLPGTWPNVPLKETIEQQVGLPTFLLNDVRSMTLGEWTFGAGRGADTIACFAIGTGIGGGLVIKGQLHLNIGGKAGELGHQVIDMNGPACGCGNRGCLEAFASGAAITAMGLKAVKQGLTTSIGEMVEYDLNRITPAVIFQAAQAGDALAIDIYEQAAFYIGIAVGNAIVMVGPQKVVIGGGVAQAGEMLLEPIRRTVRERFAKITDVSQVKIVAAELGTNAGLIGAALWARNCMTGAGR